MKSTPVAIKRKADALARGGRTFDEALEAPCMTCDSSPCCSYLPLKTMTVETLMDLDHCRYLLNFDGIELGLSTNGDWSVYLRRPCRYLDAESLGCNVHGTDLQPHICAHYNPYSCWYRTALTGDGRPDHLRVNRARLDALLPGVVFDEDRRILAVPAWEWVQETFAAIPMDGETTAAGGGDRTAPWHDEVLVRWRTEVGAGREPEPTAPRGLRVFSDPSIDEPCRGCSAPCCTTLTFPVASQLTMASIDHLRFSLGFPGVELGIAADGWVIAVRSTCRHLEDGLCSVFGQPDRPLACSYYDAYRCTYKAAYTEPRPAGYLRVGYEEFAWLLECVAFDADGNVAAVPTPDQLRWHVERRLHEHAQGLEPTPLPDIATMTGAPEETAV